MQYKEPTLSELYPIKDVMQVAILIALIIPIGISIAGLLTSR